MRKALSQHAVEATVEAVHIDDEDPGEREYSIILRDPDFITSDVSEESYIKIEVQMQKILEDGKLVLVIDTEAYTQE